ncbi:hypothetical protein GOODEAATRI_025558 [Goodea atripinnis]|uniref:Uncharacterized protein n=1 Tax=Goodea atripinnis TaxID=208336 RepID=A0ABV0NDI2_9TELE
MDGSHCCMVCGAALQADDGHDLCPTCLGRNHLVEALSENSCMNCSFMPHVHSKHHGETTVSEPPSRRKRAKSDQGLATRVELLSKELAEMKSLLQTIGEPSDDSLREVVCMALRQLHLELPLGEEFASGSAFFQARTGSFSLFCPSHLKELHACWRDPRVLSRLSTDGQVLTDMHVSVKAGLDRMPAVEPAVASLIVSRDEALCPDVRCPRTQCRVTDDLLC